MSECVVRMPDMRCNMAYHAGLRGVLTCPVTKKKCCGQAEIHCPIICALPENHGRLVDADAIIAVMDKCAETPEDSVAKLCYSYTSRILKEALTIVPAERRKP